MSERVPRFRPVLETFTPYRAGRPPSAPGGRSYKLSANESAHEPLPSVRAVLADAAASLNRYPDNGSVALTQALAARLGVPADHLAVGCGSVGLTQQLLTATVERGDEVLFGWRSFEAYPGLTELSGATSVRVPLRDHAYDLTALAAAITPRTRVIFVCNPNNPTGTVVRGAELTWFLDQVPGDCLVVLDEAYHEYIRDPQVPDGLVLYGDRPNVAVLRTFSKAYGLAALRVGYLIGHEPVATAVRKTQLAFSVNALAQTAAMASLAPAAEAELLSRTGAVVKERDRVRDELLAQGWSVPPTEANFVWLPLTDQSEAFAAACDQAGVSVRPYMPDGVRITIGEPEASDIVLAVARDWPGRV
jgi:histidinol-phosphate aminotransferase